MDRDTREVLITICETVKAEYLYLVKLQRGLADLHAALMTEFPGVEERKRSQLLSIREPAEAAGQIELIDALLSRLKKV